MSTTVTVSRAIDHARAGDREALGFLYARYADDVYDRVRHIVADRSEAEAVTREVFAQLAHAIGEYEHGDMSFLAWIVSRARSAAVEHAGRRSDAMRPHARVSHGLGVA